MANLPPNMPSGQAPTEHLHDPGGCSWPQKHVTTTGAALSSHQSRSETASSGPEISAVQYSLALTASTVGLSQCLDRFHPGSAVMELAAQRLVQEHHLPCLQGRPWCIIVKVPPGVTGDQVMLKRNWMSHPCCRNSMSTQSQAPL